MGGGDAAPGPGARGTALAVAEEYAGENAGANAGANAGGGRGPRPEADLAPFLGARDHRRAGEERREAAPSAAGGRCGAPSPDRRRTTRERWA